MSPGTQLFAPAGFRVLVKGRRYHFIHEASSESPSGARVVLAWFHAETQAAVLEYISVEQFRRGLATGLIQIQSGDAVARFPPWLADREKECVVRRTEELERQDGRPLADDVLVEARVEKIIDAARDYEEIFSQEEPHRAMNRYARRDRSNNQQRFRTWLITYIAFGFNQWALLPPKSGRGKYKRGELVDSPYGPHVKGSRAKGYPVTPEIAELSIKGFKKRAKKGQKLSDVYEWTMVEFFGCRTREINGEPSLYHPKGEPFPSYGQFRYWIVKLLGHQTVWSTLRGEAWYRTNFPAPLGSYAEGLQELMQKVYSDAAVSEERPTSYVVEGGYLPPLVEVVIVCGLSDMRLGVAFGVGSETQSLYNQALAAAALPTSLYAEVLGLKYSDEEWPVRHLPQVYQTDRGAGASAKVRKALKSLGISADMSPSYTPQSQSVIEKTHDRGVAVSGAPTFTVSKLTPLQMARERFLEIANQNHKGDITKRLSPQDLARNIRTPINFWRDRLAQGCIAGMQMSVEDVITTFLPQRVFKVIEGRLELNGQRYQSAELRQTRFAREIWKHEGEELTGYQFDISNLVAWVVIDKQLVKVKVQPGIHDRIEEYALTDYESQVHRRNVMNSHGDAAKRRRAVGVLNKTEIPERTGQPYKPNTQRKGRAKIRTAAVRAETTVLQSL